MTIFTARRIFICAAFVCWICSPVLGQSSKPDLTETSLETLLNMEVSSASRKQEKFFFRRGGDLRQCHVLFISSSEKKNLAQILDSVQGSSILTVAETGGFVRQGGMIGFVLVENRLRLEVNPQRAESSHLKISSKLLALARIVGENGVKSN